MSRLICNNVAIVTGGASGIGAALGAALVLRACHVTLADTDADGAQSTADQLSAVGPGHADAVTLDVREYEAVHEMVRRTAERHGRVDYLFNNAGVGMAGQAEELSIDHWRRTVDVNLYGVINGVMAAYPLMLEQGHGHIVNTASLAGLIPAPRMAPYAAAKFGVVGLTLALRSEAARRGVRVSAVCPGLIDTRILDTDYYAGLSVPPSMRRTAPRAWLTRAQGRPYSPAQLADDILNGVAANHALIVAPRKARWAWRFWRLSPSLMLRIGAAQFEQERRIGLGNS